MRAAGATMGVRRPDRHEPLRACATDPAGLHGSPTRSGRRMTRRSWRPPGAGTGPLRVGQPRPVSRPVVGHPPLLAGLGVTPYGLALTKLGEPAHPLYLGYDRPPVPMADGQWPRDQADTRLISDGPGLGAGPPGRRPDPLPGPRPDATQPGLLPVRKHLAGRPRVRRPDRLHRLLELVALLARPGDRQGPSRARSLWLPSRPCGSSRPRSRPKYESPRDAKGRPKRTP